MLKSARFMRRMLVVFMGLILILVSVIQIVNHDGQLWLNLIFMGLGLFEIVLALSLIRFELHNAQKTNSSK